MCPWDFVYHGLSSYSQESVWMGKLVDFNYKNGVVVFCFEWSQQHEQVKTINNACFCN